MKAVKMDDDYRDFQLCPKSVIPYAGGWPVGNKRKDVINSYITGNIPGGLGSHDGNGVTS